jgi:hypothetical protein
MRGSGHGGGRWLLAVGFALLGAGCTDTVYRDAPLFREPPSAAAGFLGYDERDERLTVCGNCHVGQQSEWEETAHADAFATLASSGEMQGFCQGCHTVNARGNASPDENGGWVGTSDPRYHDVQCENCHGPGQTHVSNPDATQPLAPLSVGVDLTIGCGECHNGIHHPFVEEWEQSGHGAVLASPAGRAECQGCHTGQAALRAWGVTADYIEKSSTTHLPIVCGVCHDPHSNRASRRVAGDVGDPIGMPESGGQLRYSVDVPNEEENLCMKCHHKRAQPDIDPATQTSRGPHSPEGPLLLGENAGFWFGDLSYDAQRIVGTHGTERNPRLCATCHMVRYPITDQATGDLTFQVTGHMFKAIPCLTLPDSIPRPDDNCTLQERSFKGCTLAGCHGNQDAARSAYLTAETDINRDAAILKALIDQVRSTEVVSGDNRWTTAEGADFNWQLAVKRGSETHNPFLIKALLNASINEMRTKYNLP